MRTKFQMYADESDEWIKVPLTILNELGILNDISENSFLRDENAYLSVASDMDKFLSVMREKGHPMKFVNYRTKKRSKIHGYLVYTPRRAKALL